MATGTTILEGIDLTRSFGEGETASVALDSVTLACQRGEIILIMGPSGSGKSTLLAVLSGLLRPSRGQVLALGQDLWGLSDQQRKQFRLSHCGFIFQGYNLFPALTARQQLEIVLRWGESVPAREARRRAEEMLDALDLSAKADLRPNQLSGGEKQRVAVGRALVKEPAFCFADEPTSALDWAHGRHAIELLRDAARRRRATILMVAHDARIIPYTDRVLYLQDGCLVQPEAGAGVI